MRIRDSRKPQALLLIALAILAAVLACNLPTSLQKGGSLTQDEALQLVLDEIVKPDLLGEDPLVIFAWPDPLVQGDALHPYAIYGEDTDTELVAVKAESWFFWIEDKPYAQYAHSSRFVLVEMESGEISVSNQEWWPVLNGQGLWTGAGEYQNEENWAWSNASFIEQTANSNKGSSSGMAALVPPRQESSQAESGKRRALVINTNSEEGIGEDDGVADAKNMLGFLDKYDFESTYLGVKYDNNPRRVGTPFLKGVDRSDHPWKVWLQNMAEVMNPGDTLVVYITGHGGDGSIGNENDEITAYALKYLLEEFKPCVDIIVIISACESGVFIDKLKDVADLTMTSADGSSDSYLDVDFWFSPFLGIASTDFNPLDEGTEYTSSFIAGWENILEDPALMEKVNGRVKNEGRTFMQALCTESYKEGRVYDFGARFGSSPQISYGSEKSSCEAQTGISVPESSPTPTSTSTPTQAPTPTPSEDSAEACAVFEEIEIPNTIMRHMRECKPTLNFYYKMDTAIPGLASASPIAWDYWVLVNGKQGNCFLEEGFEDRLYCQVDISADEAYTLGHFELFANPCQEPISVLDLTIPKLEGCEEPLTETEEPSCDS